MDKQAAAPTLTGQQSDYTAPCTAGLEPDATPAVPEVTWVYLTASKRTPPGY